MAYQNLEPFENRTADHFFSDWWNNAIGFETTLYYTRRSSSSNSFSATSKSRVTTSVVSGLTQTVVFEASASSYADLSKSQGRSFSSSFLSHSNISISGQTETYTSGSPVSTLVSTIFHTTTTTTSASASSSFSFSATANNDFSFTGFYNRVGGSHNLNLSNETFTSYPKTYFGETLVSGTNKVTSSWTDREVGATISTAIFGGFRLPVSDTYANGFNDRLTPLIPVFRMHPFDRRAVLRPDRFATLSKNEWREEASWFTNVRQNVSSFAKFPADYSAFAYLATGDGQTIGRPQTFLTNNKYSGSYQFTTTKTIGNRTETYLEDIDDEFAPGSVTALVSPFAFQTVAGLTTRKLNCEVYALVGDIDQQGNRRMRLTTAQTTYWATSTFDTYTNLAAPAFSLSSKSEFVSSGTTFSSSSILNGGITAVGQNLTIGEQKVYSLIPQGVEVYVSKMKSNLYAPFNTSYNKNLPLFSSSTYTILSGDGGTFTPYFPGFSLFPGVQQFVEPLRGYYTFLVNATTTGSLLTTSTREPIVGTSTYLSTTTQLGNTDSVGSRNQIMTTLTSQITLNTTYTNVSGTFSSIFEDTVLPLRTVGSPESVRKSFIFKRGSSVQTVVIGLGRQVAGENLFEIDVADGVFETNQFIIGGVDYPASFFGKNYKSTIELFYGNWLISKYNTGNQNPQVDNYQIFPLDFDGLRRVTHINNNEILFCNHKNVYRTELVTPNFIDPYGFLEGVYFDYTRELFATVQHDFNGDINQLNYEKAGRNPRVFDTAQIYTNGFPERRMNHSSFQPYQTINII
jgi:hypothetical protein